MISSNFKRLSFVAFALFFSCKSSDNNSLVYWSVGSATNDNYVHSDLFNAKSEFHVETISVPWTEYDKKTLTAILSGNPPDIMSQFAPLKTWASRRSLLSLDSFIKNDNFDTTQFFKFLWDEMKWENKVYGIPINTSSYAFFCNMDHFNNLGIYETPSTWDEVKVIAKKMNRYDKNGNLVRAGFLPNYGNFMTTNVIAWQLGEKYFTNDDEVRLNTPQVKESFLWVKNFIDEIGLDKALKLIGSFGFADQHGFISGRVGMMILDSSFPKLLEKYNPNLNYKVIPIPSYNGSKSISSAAVWWVGIPRGVKNPEKSWEFIKFLSSTQNQLDYLTKTNESLFSANIIAAKDSINYSFPYYNVFMDQLEVSKSPSIFPLVHDIFWREYKMAQDKVILSDLPVSQVLESAEHNVQTSLDKALKYYEYVSEELNE